MSVLGDQAISVSQLATKIDHAIKGGLPGQFAVVGEISSLSHRTHYYFSLKDEQAVIGAVVFASAARRMAYTPHHGDSVIAKGRIEFYAPSGRISLIVTSLTPVGEGQLERKFKERCEQLRSQGWFDPSTKQPIPDFPRRIAIVTSKDGAAIADVIDTMKSRCEAIELLIVDVRVQGAQAKSQIAHAIERLNENADHLRIDGILLTRGGGSLEDLWAFNEMEVAQAIHGSRLPIVAAIGHETDTTIAELVADLRCATPTQAAMNLSPDRDALIEQLMSLQGRLDRSIHSQLRYEKQRLDSISTSRSMGDPRQIIKIYRDQLTATADRLAGKLRNRVASNRARLDRIAIKLARHQPTAVHARREEHLTQVQLRLKRVMERAITKNRNDLESISRELVAIGPAQVLARGYSVTALSDGSLIRSVTDAKPGETIVNTFADGKVRSVVEGGRGDNDADPRLLKNKPTAPRRRSKGKSSKSTKSESRDQLDLF